ncbi:MAG: M20 family peptidase [Acutalibacteraceae bacterium]|jgi:carboxypeptidase PM20D1
MQDFLLILLIVFAGFILITLVRAAFYKPKKRDTTPLPPEKLDVDRYVRNLSDAIKIKTISSRDSDRVNWAEFEAFHALLEERYPLIHKTLEKELVSKASLMYRWKGKNPQLKPIALLAHQDVVPISAGTAKDWKYPPFDGTVAEGYIWGRGSLDMKNHLIAVMESIETLLEEGFEPERDVYLCFGHDEEIMLSDDSGALNMARLFKERGIELESVIDEGGAIIPAKIKGLLDINIAGVGIAEKGYADFEIAVTAKGGHSSQPPNHTALGEMAVIIQTIENHQFKAKLTPYLKELFRGVGRHMSYPGRIVTCNLSLLWPVVKAIMKRIPAAASMIRNTTAVTMASGSPAPNVLPQTAKINVNFRIMPGSSIKDVEKHLRKIIKNKNVTIRLVEGKEPSAISPTDSETFKVIEDICYRMNEKNLVAPYLVMGGTDACRYEDVAKNIYRYSPFVFGTELLLTTHGTNERLPIDSVEDAVAFFKRYVRSLAGKESK